MIVHCKRTPIRPLIQGQVREATVCIAFQFETRQEFAYYIDRWNWTYRGVYTYQEVPLSCVKRLFGNVKLTPGFQRNWPM